MTKGITLGIRANPAQISWLVVVNAVVEAMVGIARTIPPPIAEAEIHLPNVRALCGGTTAPLAQRLSTT